ncbi:Protein of unknown function [Gryllus bimaculatus]|nr:Protein of unknown function [Gryllus bimaculatus]
MDRKPFPNIIVDRGSAKNGPLLCNCKWSRRKQPPSPVICSYCCDWAREYIHMGKSSSASSIKTPQNLLSRFLQSLTGMPGPSLGKGEPLCQLWVIHYHSQKSSRASESRNSNIASRSRSLNRASRSRSPNRALQSRSVNRATRSKSPNCTSQSSSNQVSGTSVTKVLSTLFEKPRTRSQSRSSGCHKPVSDYSKSPQISSQVRLTTCGVSSDKQSSDSESRLHYYELKTRRHTYRNQKDSKEKRKRSTSPGTSNNKRREKSFQTNIPLQVSPSRKSPRKKTLSQSADSATDNKSKLLAQNTQNFSSLALAKLASFQPVVLLKRYNVRRRERSVERDNHRRTCQKGRSRRDQFTLQKQLQLEANDNAHKLWEHDNAACQTRNDERKRTRSVSRNFKNFRERSPVRTRSRSRSLGEDIQRSLHSHENVNGGNSKKKRTVKEVIVIPEGRPFASTFETVSSSDETDVEIEVGEDALDETIASISEYCKIDSEGSDEIEDVVEVGEDSLNDTIASISGLGSITYDEDCSSYVIAPSSSCSGNFSNISSNCEDNCSVISISSSVKSSSSSSSSSLVSNSSPLYSSQSSCISPQPPPTPCPQCSPISSPPSCLSSSCVSPLSMIASPAIFSSPAIGSQDTSGSVIKPTEYKHQLPIHISNISSQLVRSPLPGSVVAESTEPPSPATSIPLRRSSRRFCSPHDSILPSTSRASRRMHSDMCSEIPIRGSSPPPIFPNRSGSLTELECRIKARALTARKFVPFSPAARQQRAMMRQLQGRR